MNFDKGVVVHSLIDYWLTQPYKLYQLYKPFIKKTPAKLYQSHSLIDWHNLIKIQLKLVGKIFYKFLIVIMPRNCMYPATIVPSGCTNVIIGYPLSGVSLSLSDYLTIIGDNFLVLELLSNIL